MRPQSYQLAFLLAFGVVITYADILSAQTLKLSCGVQQVAIYERADFKIVGVGDQVKPFDPEQVDCRLEIRAPSGKSFTLPAFYAQDYEFRNDGAGAFTRDWTYPIGKPGWCARFAPIETGEYSIMVRVTAAGTTRSSNTVRLRCISGKSHGFVRVSKTARRYLETSDGHPFFAIGQNLAFIKDVREMSGWLGKLGQNGGNYVRVWACCGDWGLALEDRKSAWGRSWDWNPPFVTLPGGAKCVKIDVSSRAIDVSPTRGVALKPGKNYVLTGSVQADVHASLQLLMGGTPLSTPIDAIKNWTPFTREFTSGPQDWWMAPLALRANDGAVKLKDISLRESGKGPELLEEADPDRQIVGNYNMVDCFLMDKVMEAAEQNGVKLQLVVLSRDLGGKAFDIWSKDPKSADYDAAIKDARNLLRYAVARWGYSQSLGMWEYYNEFDPGAPTERFYTELAAYLDKNDPYHHPHTTSTWGPSPKDWKLTTLDTTNLHPYMRNVKDEPYKDETVFVLEKGREALESQPVKPVLMSEFGLADDKFGLSPYLKNDTQLVHIHNSLWASALSGLAGTTMTWWWETLAPMNNWRHYMPIAAFTADIPFTKANLKPFSHSADDKSWRLVGLHGDKCAYLWFSNPDATYYKIAVEIQSPKTVEGAMITLNGLTAGRYQVEWWDTWTGKPTKKEVAKASGGVLRIVAPGFSRDVACKIQFSSMLSKH